VAIALNLMPDPEITLEIERLYAGLAALRVPEGDLVTQFGPCVTVLMIGNRVKPDLVVDILKWKLPELMQVPLNLTEPCIMPGTPPTLCLRVKPIQALLTVHHTLFQEMPEEEVHLHYRPAYWQPHLKLANIQGEQPGGAALLAHLTSGWRSLVGTLTHLEAIEYPPAQVLWQATLA